MARNKYPEETVNRILDAAAQLFTERGYDKTSLQDIIQMTGLSKGAIYHHFASKEDIFLKICDRMGQENAERLEQIRDRRDLNGLEKLRLIFREALLSHNQRRIMDITPYLLDNPRFLAMDIRGVYEDSAPDYIEPILREGIADGSIHTEYPRELAEVMMILSDVWLHPSLQPTTPEEMRTRCILYNQLTRPFGFEVLDDDLIEAMVRYTRELQDQQKGRVKDDS